MNRKKSLNPITLTRLVLLIMLAVTFQLAAGILPGLGCLLGIFSTLPIISAARLGPVPGAIAYLTSSLLIFFFNPTAGPIFWLATGLLGLVLGLGYYYSWTDLQLILYPGLLLSLSVYLLTTGFNFALINKLTVTWGPIIKLSIIIPFAFGYAALWQFLFPLILKTYKQLVNSNSSW